MKRRSSHKSRIAAVLVVFALLCSTMASGTTARWECLDGHPCGPGCKMLHGGASCPLKSGQHSGQATCPLCPQNERHVSRRSTGDRCTSNVCVLRIRSNPDAAVWTSTTSQPDSAAVIPCIWTEAPLPLVSGQVCILPARAPPRDVKLDPSAPRAPPVLS